MMRIKYVQSDGRWGKQAQSIVDQYLAKIKLCERYLRILRKQWENDRLEMIGSTGIRVGKWIEIPDKEFLIEHGSVDLSVTDRLNYPLRVEIAKVSIRGTNWQDHVRLELRHSQIIQLWISLDDVMKVIEE